MDCKNLNGILGCTMSVGGIKDVYIFNFGDVFDYQYTDDNINFISSYKFKKLAAHYKTLNTSSLRELFKSDTTDVYTQTLNLKFPQMSKDKRDEFRKLTRGKYTIIVKDNNNKCWIVGKEFGCVVSDFSAKSDSVGNDNTYDITFTTQSKYMLQEISCYDERCAVSVFGREVRQSTFIINSASTYDFSGEYELLGDTITRSFTPIVGLEPLLWTDSAIYNRDLGTLQSLMNPNGQTVVEFAVYDTMSDVVLITYTSTDTSYPVLSINNVQIFGSVFVALNLQTIISTAIPNITIELVDSFANVLYNLPFGDVVSTPSLSGISNNVFIDVTTLYPSGQTFTINVNFDGESCNFATFEYVYEPSNVCQVVNTYELYNGKHYSCEVDKNTNQFNYKFISIKIGNYVFNLYDDNTQYHSSFTTLETDILSILNSYPDLNISNVTVTETAKTWILTFDSIDSDLLFYVITRNDDLTTIGDANLEYIRKYPSIRSIVLGLYTVAPSDSTLFVENLTNSEGFNGLYSDYPTNLLNDIRIEDVAPYTSNICRSIGIDITNWVESDVVEVTNDSPSCPDATNNFTINTCLDTIEHTTPYKYYLLNFETLVDSDLGDYFIIDTTFGVLDIYTPNSVTYDNLSNLTNSINNELVLNGFENKFKIVNFWFDKVICKYQMEVLVDSAETLNSIYVDFLSNSFTIDTTFDVYNYKILSKQHPDIDLTWDITTTTGITTLSGKTKDFIKEDIKKSTIFGDFNYNSTTDEFTINFVDNPTLNGKWVVSFHQNYPTTTNALYDFDVVSPSLTEIIPTFSSLLTINDINYIRLVNDLGFVFDFIFTGATQQNISINLVYYELFVSVFGRFDDIFVNYTVGLPHPMPYLTRFSANCPSYDMDVLNFLSVAGITDTIIGDALNVFVTGMKADGTWVLCDAIYPFVGGTAHTHKFNLKNPVDSDAAFRILFNGGWSHSALGITPNGINSHADTRYNQQTNTVLDDNHISIYSQTNIQALYIDIGVSNGATSATDITPRYNSGGEKCFMRNTTITDFFLNNDSTGFFINNRPNSTTIKGVRNGVINTLTANSTATVNYNYYLGAMNVTNTPTFRSIRTLSFASLGNSFTDAQLTMVNNRVQTLQSALSR